MKTAVINWELPTTRTSGGPLPANEISGTQVALSADGGSTFTVLQNVPAAEVQSITIPDLEVGTWVVRFVVSDTQNRVSAPVTVPFDIVPDVDNSPPNGVVNVQVTFQ